MALDILTVLATSDDCERAFGEAGDLLELRLLKLRPNIIVVLQCNRSYLRIGFKDLVDKQDLPTKAFLLKPSSPPCQALR
ncbi:uncharacterized protein K441DRAFT_669397 [Cenococcum geophilum 1.58]|uniref:Uncharacterized protein n=1 Tax=Cenococcum geophilum 1.58 TaxID=794803 RepID=A0ACC8EPL7_9PEZI|nr:hypothetical protein K441DRAFT_669397 [Cenococcum geophilum 1.58]